MTPPTPAVAWKPRPHSEIVEHSDRVPQQLSRHRESAPTGDRVSWSAVWELDRHVHGKFEVRS